jgi:thymidylate kinase
MLSNTRIHLPKQQERCDEPQTDETECGTETYQETNIDPSAIEEKIISKYTVLDSNTFGLAKATISVLEPGIYRAVYKNYDFQLFKDKVVSDDIVITSETSKKIVSQIKDFWGMEEQFKENGILHKRGFLLTGKPGSGKSSIITAIMADAVKNGCIVFIPAPKDVGEDLTSCMKKIKTVEPEKKVLVILEDFESYTEGNNSYKTKWLNILDGTDGYNNVVYLATSNYPELIDSRFTTRPSRFDTVYIIECPNFDDRLKYIKNKKMNISDDVAEDIAKKTDKMSYAHIKEYLISTYLFKLNPDTTLQRMLDQGEHPISSDDFEDNKKVKLGFEGPGKEEGIKIKVVPREHPLTQEEEELFELIENEENLTLKKIKEGS